MYFRGNSASEAEGERRRLDIGLELRGRPGAPARAVWRWRTPLRRLVVGLRWHIAGGDGQAADWTLALDGQALSLNDVAVGHAVASHVAAGRDDDGRHAAADHAAAGRDDDGRHAAGYDADGLRRSLAEIDLPAVDPAREHELTLEHRGPAPLEVRDAIVRARGLGDDPIGDELLIEEGRYWSAWVGAHHDAGDRSISDGEVRGTHPSFLPIGVRHPDMRDRRRRWGFFPDRFTDFLLRPLAERRGGLGLDVGTGCGQFALQAARQGLRMIGVDLGAGLLRIAREVAREHPDLRLDYLRAEALRLPLRDGSCDVVTAKESLHHLPDVPRAFAEIRRVLKGDGLLVASEQVYAAPWVNRLLARTTLLLRPLILRRHSAGPVPAELSFPSPLEDRGSNEILPAFRAAFARRRTRARWIYVDFVEMHVHYAFDRFRWLLGPPIVALAWLIEAGIRLAAGRPLGMGLEGSDKR
jgi:SAM-dependent methyltransferase